MIKVLTEFTKQAAALIKKVGIKDARKQKPEWFTDTGKRKTTKLDPRTGKPVSGPGTKGGKAASAPKKSSAWGRLPESVRTKLLAGNTKGMSPEQLAKYRTLYKNRNA